jgi:MFS family permease
VVQSSSAQGDAGSAVRSHPPAPSSEDTGASVTTLQWAVTGYSLVGAVIGTSGFLGDVFGLKRVFPLGLLLFVASCVLNALAGSGAR